MEFSLDELSTLDKLVLVALHCRVGALTEDALKNILEMDE